MLAEYYFNLNPSIQAGLVIGSFAFALVAIPIIIHKIKEKFE
jgi:hypothetical protein